ncbi:hypothetical protein [Salinibacter ruber]|uniref:hypothetical protein n=1 Tax=Salinibacter ruber TaxID=146919 RepID=UPI001610683E|nr:hypothetical protein [Salinibacter ruber]MBB4059634.1 hypothetical protein [Salinibacter ruber]
MTTLSLLTSFALALSLAYLDPVTGTFIVQTIIGGLLGGWYILKKYYNRIHAYLAGTTGDEEASVTDGN